MTSYRIVDVCGTLVRDDTTIGLLAWHFARSRRWRLLGLNLLTARASPLRVLVAIAEKAMGRHVLKLLLVRWLRGDTVADVAASASDYADWLLANRRVNSVREVLAAAPGPLVLASASLEPVVQVIAARMNADFVASSLAVEEGRYTGRYINDITGRKREALNDRLGLEWAGGPYLAISDNLTDRALLEGAKPAFVVLHNPGHKTRWNGMDAEFLLAC
ncbi:haloacid dehalogenase-like hydrolase [Lysobacter sp. F6437]|uniref:haloacid dehalogenase-like hydrolase n=1 Tax=Lysobacter sp. F6437 TaxID=3459296 RepID=UPI00403DDD02